MGDPSDEVPGVGNLSMELRVMDGLIENLGTLTNEVASWHEAHGAPAPI